MGLSWKPKPKGPKRDPIPRKVRNQFFAETLNVLRYWKYLGKQITAEQFSLLINDLRPKDETTTMWARWYASEFGFEGFTYTKHHTYTADQRAKTKRFSQENTQIDDKTRQGLKALGYAN